MSNKHEASSNVVDNELKNVIAAKKPRLPKIILEGLRNFLRGVHGRSTENTNATKDVGETITDKKTDELVKDLFGSRKPSLWEKYKNGEVDFNTEIFRRFGLLIHKDAEKFNEKRVWANDCTLLKEALMTKERTKKRDQQRKRIFIASIDNSKSMFLRILAKREDEILKGLQSYFRSEIEDSWTSFEASEIFTEMYLLIRLLKALHIHCEKKNIEFPNAFVEILNAVKYRWQVAYERYPEDRGDWLSENKILADKITKSNASDFVREYKKLLSNCEDAHLKGQELHKFADDIFCESMYLSGFPNSSYVSAYLMYPAFAPLFQGSFDKIKMAGARKYSQAKEKTMAEEIDRLFHIIVICLSRFYCIKGVRDRWLWIHFAGHGRCELLPMALLDNLDDMIKVSSELFTHTAISMDCCFPNIKLPAPSRTCAIFPLDSTDGSRYSNMFSDFTSLLSFALEGFRCEGCYPRMKSVFWQVQHCSCDTCEEYRKSLIPSEDERITNKLSTVYCGHCKKLREKCTGKNGLIYPADICEYLEKHLCSNIYEPHWTPGSNKMEKIPLMKIL